ncbi:major facilitator superfamily protein [Hirsutella rhossiliensis]|uniref:Major facilitator superfamily domain-containing protein n=1 Tax=Hirsutella rhossiliensis TaxID=111463 RepID=A0A9P8MYU5_9HYPO|nr:major facilitator superfamily domain-containing protein [Hirsutella rhossiliensis]KAH0964913.1 major facilitator superfamily domain-containing protein [Hirsutella rhossiliensis]
MIDRASSPITRPGERTHHSRPISRRFTTLEGWRQTRDGLYLAAGSTISSLIPNPSYDAEWQIHDDGPVQTRLSVSSRGSSFTSGTLLYGQGGRQRWSTMDEHDPPVGPLGTQDEDPFADSNALEPHGEKGPIPVEETEKPFHVFTRRQKWFAIATIGVAGLFSGLSSNIYFPALGSIAQDLHVSLSAVSLTITSYLVIQGISPLIWGSLSDTLGRRPIYIYSFSVYIIANVVLSFSPNFAVLLVFRGLQAAGSASTVSIGNGVIQDIALPVERGAFISFYQAIRNFSIAIGPVLGGLFDNFFGFRSIFVFLLIASSLVLIVIVLFLPETLRTIAGDGSLRLSGIHRPLIQRYVKEPVYVQDPDGRPPRPRVTVGTFLRPLKLLTEKDILVSLIFGGVVYAVWSMVVASTTGLFKERFNLSELLLGLAFLPNGAGTIVGSAIAGKLMTLEFLKSEEVYMKKNPGAALPSQNKKNLPLDFPIEHARLRHVPWITALFVLLTSRPGWIAVPLLLQFIIAATSNAVFAINTALVADLCPGQGASATAVNNLVRCSLGALGVASVDAMLAAFGPAATFLSLGLVSVAMGVLLAAEWSWGMQWRGSRERATEAQANGAWAGSS